MTDRKIRVLVVDDSPVARELLVHILNADPQLSVVATADNGMEAIGAIEAHHPDLVTMDVQMPGMNGFEATRRIMETQPVPVVIVTGAVDPKEAAIAFEALEAGALAILERPPGLRHPDHDAAVRKLILTIKAMSEVKVVRRWVKNRAAVTVAPPPVKPVHAEIRVVAIGVSTGGPPVLHTILAGLPRDYPVPILIVQHISAGFLEGLVDWLGGSTGFAIRSARHGEQLTGGQAYLAPDGFHMGVDRQERIELSNEPADNGLRPSVAHLFRSVAEVYGKAAIGVLLTGMGRDGADELKRMRERGALTIAQDKESSVVYGMPGEAIRIDAAAYVLSPERIVATLRSIVSRTEQITGHPQ